MKKALTLGIAGVLFASLACSSSDEDGGNAAPDRPTATGAAAEGTAESCEDGAATAARIAEGLTVDGGGTLANAQAVRSADFASAWFVAAEIDGPGLEGSGDVGVWATNDLANGLIFSINAVAEEFSDWGHGDETDAQFSMSDHGAGEAFGCVS